MQVGLFIPCYMDQFFPAASIAVVKLLEHFDVKLSYPPEQTCCGQPLANSGFFKEMPALAKRFRNIFSAYDYIVCPSGSCTSMVRHHYQDYLDETFEGKLFELTEFLVDVLKIESITGKFPYRVGVHQSCHGLRELGLAASSELVCSSYNKVASLLESIQEIELITLQRPDECCGFGGLFSIGEEAISCKMGQDRIDDHLQGGAEIITSVDMSCLMHLDGLIRRQKLPVKIMHLAEILLAALEHTDEPS